jgi:predicted DNA-binding transcriptional regulator AlpA
MSEQMSPKQAATEFAFEDGRNYSQSAVATALCVTERAIEKWRKKRRNRFPAPFKMGRTPYWTGRTINAWIQRQQQEALA